MLVFSWNCFLFYFFLTKDVEAGQRLGDESNLTNRLARWWRKRGVGISWAISSVHQKGNLTEITSSKIKPALDILRRNSYHKINTQIHKPSLWLFDHNLLPAANNSVRAPGLRQQISSIPLCNPQICRSWSTPPIPHKELTTWLFKTGYSLCHLRI